MSVVYISGLILGLSSSLHCLGMCGPLVMAIPMKRHTPYIHAWGITQYHLGKTLTYAVLGFMIGLVGLSVQTFKWMQILSIVSGVVIIAFAWGKFIHIPVGKALVQKFIRFSGKALRNITKSDIPFKPFFFGMINGLLPCGLVYIALINSLLVSSPFQSSIAMVFFGLGTVPILTVARLASEKIRWKTNRLTPVLITFVGAMIIFRGLNLGIPYLSPKMEIKQANLTTGEKETATVSCCHKEASCEKE